MGTHPIFESDFDCLTVQHSANMRTRLLTILRQGAQTSEKFADYNFRSYFVAKFNQQIAAIETAPQMTITEQMLATADSELAVVTRQTTIQTMYTLEPNVIEFANKN